MSLVYLNPTRKNFSGSCNGHVSANVDLVNTQSRIKREMTSSRSQNVSVLPHSGVESWEPSIVTFTGTSGSLRSAPRNNSFRNYRNGKTSSRGSPTPSLTEAFKTLHSTSSQLNTVQRELSPVRWCDREVDGVYLGKSGWVQVHQKSLQDCKKVFDGASTFSSRKNHTNRPGNLPLSKREIRQTRERPSKFFQEFDSMSPPSDTPIISPPPAFKDVEFSRKTPTRSFESSRVDWNEPVSGFKHHRPLYQTLHTKSLEDESGNGWRKKRSATLAPFALFGFRSLDNDVRESANESLEDGINSDERGQEDSKRYYLDRDTSKERFEKSKSRSRNHRIGRRPSPNDFIHKRSPSSDSISSDSSDNSEKSARRIISKTLEAVNKGSKQSYVKRSRSLQLSEKRSPSELIFLNQSSSGKSWDPMPFEHVRNHTKERSMQYPQRPQHTLVTVNGESIPVYHQSFNSLSKITTSEAEQKKLILEAEKEARIISEFLNGTRSRTAARNLLMHRYFKQPENECPSDLIKKTDDEAYLKRVEQRSQNKGFHKKNQLRSSEHSTVSSKPLAFLFRNFPNHPDLRFKPEENRSKRSSDSRIFFPADQVVYSNEKANDESSSMSSSTSSSSEDVSHIGMKSSQGSTEMFYSRPGSAPENDECVSSGIDQRSLSLPRSFLSEHYKINYLYQRDSFPNVEERLNDSNAAIDESPMESQETRTAPTTPVRDLRYNRGSVSSKRLQSTKSSCNSLSDESGFVQPCRFTQQMNDESERSAVGSNNRDTFLIYNSPQRISDTPLETILQKFKKNFTMKNFKGKNKEALDLDTENSSEGYSVPNGSVCSLQGYENKNSHQEFGFIKKRGMGKRGFKNEKYDSHDSGIQMGHRGNVDSSESLDTDLQEDVDSPPAVRRHEMLRFSDNFCRPQSEIFNQVLIDKFKADLQWRTKAEKNSNGRGVRRTNSDLGGQRLYNWDVKNGRRFVSQSSSMRGSHGRAPSKPLSPEELERRLSRPRLRRSLSQPLGLNELPTFVRRRSSTLKGFAMSEDEKNPREDEFLSDSGSSVASLSERKKSDFSIREEAAILAEAVWDHVAMESCELPFRAGDVIEVLDTRDRDWWWGVTKEACGYFPSAFVRLRVSQEDTVEDCLAAMAKGKTGPSQLRRGKSVSLLSNDQVRSSVVKELLNTERDFVKILRDVQEGYVVQCKRRTDMFSMAQISAIFSNLEDLLVFQETFLKDLEMRIDRKWPYKSCIGEVFLNHASGFRMYSEYCNSHPMAIATLQELYQRNDYCQFFETCRLKQNLIEIPLDGYLLTPVQRICKYPLQLAELLKYTKPDHPDFKKVEEALETMRRVATLINERKRRMESLEKLAAWQQRVDGWEGEDLIEISSRLIHQSDVVRITSAMWTTNITLFLFDRQIIYCKKDLLKRNVYTYKGRIYLKNSVVIDLPDGKNQQLGVTIKHGLKISNTTKEKWLMFCCRSKEDKIKWLEALDEEKRFVAQEKEVDLDLPPTAKQLAKMAARTKKCPPYKPRGKTKLAGNHEELILRRAHPEGSKFKSARRVGNWFTFAGVMKNSKVNQRPREPLHEIT